MPLVGEVAERRLRALPDPRANQATRRKACRQMGDGEDSNDGAYEIDRGLGVDVVGLVPGVAVSGSSSQCFAGGRTSSASGPDGTHNGRA